MIIILKKGVAIFHRRNNTWLYVLAAHKVMRIKSLQNMILTLIFTEPKMTLIALQRVKFSPKELVYSIHKSESL